MEANKSSFIKKTKEEVEKEIDEVFLHFRELFINLMKKYADDERFEDAKVADMRKDHFFAMDALGHRVCIIGDVKESSDGPVGAVIFGDENPRCYYTPNDYYYSGEYAMFMMELEMQSYIRHWTGEELDPWEDDVNEEEDEE